MAETATGDLTILDPTVGLVAREVKMMPRLDSLDGKVVGLLGNAKANADQMLGYLQAMLARQYRVKEFVVRAKRDPSRVASASLLDELAARCDAVITGVGD